MHKREKKKKAVSVFVAFHCLGVVCDHGAALDVAGGDVPHRYRSGVEANHGGVQHLGRVGWNAEVVAVVKAGHWNEWHHYHERLPSLVQVGRIRRGGGDDGRGLPPAKEAPPRKLASERETSH